MPHAYTEDQLVEQPAIDLFAELGWAVAGPPPNAGVAGEPRASWGTVAADPDSRQLLDFNWASSSARRCLSGAIAVSTSASV